MYIYINIYIFMYKYIFIYVYIIHIYTHIYIYIYICMGCIVYISFLVNPKDVDEYKEAHHCLLCCPYRFECVRTSACA